MLKTSSKAQAAFNIIRWRTMTTGCSIGRLQEASKNMAPEGTSWHLLDPTLPVWAAVSHRLHLPGCPSPGPRSVPEPQFQTWRHHSVAPSRQKEHCHVDVTIGKNNYLYSELKKNHLHSQTEAKSNFANVSRTEIVLCLPNISRRYYAGVGSLLICDNSIKIW